MKHAEETIIRLATQKQQLEEAVALLREENEWLRNELVRLQKSVGIVAETDQQPKESE